MWTISTSRGLFAETINLMAMGLETAFQIFIIGPRRLLADRFYTVDYRPEIYTQIGFDWVEKTTMVDVIKDTSSFEEKIG